jgi:hypothetical protein
MCKRNLPQPFQIDKMRFGDCFTAPSFRHFGVLITGWVLTVGVHTISQVILIPLCNSTSNLQVWKVRH